MSKRKNAKGFTLIELIAVLVILAVIALIVTPLVLNVVRKAKDSANKRSVDAYGKAIDLAVASYLLDTGDFPTCESDLKIEYSGNEVNCNIMNLNENGNVYLSECAVGGKEVKDSKTEDGFYHYGSIYMKNEYQKYTIGDKITINNINFYVIKNSDENTDYLTLLKEIPLTVNEINSYGNGYINKNTYSSIGTVTDINGYGAISYYSSATCGWIDQLTSYKYTGCNTDYKTSDIKYIVDNWLSNNIDDSLLKEDNLGYKARLITKDELVQNLGYISEDGATELNFSSEYTPNWVYNSSYNYWTMGTFYDYNDRVWIVSAHGNLKWFAISGWDNKSEDDDFNTYQFSTVRPVINLYKSAINGSQLQKGNFINLKCN